MSRLPVQHNEFVSLVPLASLAIVYWLRDRYVYNRAPVRWYTATRVQLQVLLLVWPLWVFLQWMQYLQIRRGTTLVYFTAFGSHIVNHYTTVGVLNDSFRQTRQQLMGFAIGLIITYGWTITNVVSFGDASSEEGAQVDCVCDENR